MPFDFKQARQLILSLSEQNQQRVLDTYADHELHTVYRFLLNELVNRDEKKEVTSKERSAVDLIFSRVEDEYKSTVLAKEERNPFGHGINQVWEGKYGKPTYRIDGAKEDGCAVGFVAKKDKTKPGAVGDPKKWIAKLSVSTDGPFVYPGYDESQKIRHSMALGAVLEKVAADGYTLVANELEKQLGSHASFNVPKHRLAKLPIENEQTKKHPLLKHMLNLMEKRGIEQKEGTYVMSRMVKGYHDFCELDNCVFGNDVMPFNEMLDKGYVPEMAVIEGRRVPIQGLMSLIATGKLLADTDVLGGKCSNAGFIEVRDSQGNVTALKAVKVDTGEAFSFTNVDKQNQFLQTYTEQGCKRPTVSADRKNIQFGASQPRCIQWDRLSEAQQKEFITTMDIGLKLFRDKSLLNTLVTRDGAFDKALEDEVLLDEYFMVNFHGYLERYLDVLEGDAYHQALLNHRCMPIDVEQPQVAPQHSAA